MTLRFATAREVFDAMPTVADDMVSGPSDESPATFVRTLAASETPEDAIAFLSYVLGRREAVWWSCQCVRALNDIAAGHEDEALRAAEAWVRSPGEDKRRAALALGLSGDKALASSWLVLAAGWSGGNLTEGPTPVPTRPHLTPRAARGAILVALARKSSAQRAASLNLCVDAGLRLVGGMA